MDDDDMPHVYEWAYEREDDFIRYMVFLPDNVILEIGYDGLIDVRQGHGKLEASYSQDPSWQRVE